MQFLGQPKLQPILLDHATVGNYTKPDDALSILIGAGRSRMVQEIASPIQ
jgi:hypothetical protein